MRLHDDSSTYCPYTCGICNQGFKAGKLYREHQLYCCNPLERPHLCVHCGKRFKLKQALELHCREVHKLSYEEARALVYPGLPIKQDREEKPKRKRKKKKIN